MVFFACFSTSSQFEIRATHDTKFSANKHTCSLAPEHSSGDQSTIKPGKSQSQQFYRILPQNLPKSKRPPYPPRHFTIPYIGIFIERFLRIVTTTTEKARKYGPIYNNNSFLFDQTIVAHHDAVTEILRNAEIFISAPAFPTFRAIFGDDTIIALDGDEHAKARALLAPAFAPGLFNGYFDKICRHVHLTWERVHTSIARGEQVLLDPILREHYLSIIVETTTGVDMEGADATRIRSLYNTLLSGPGFRFGSKWAKSMKAREELMVVLAQVVTEKISTHRKAIEKLREYGDDVVRLGLRDIAKGDVDILMVSIANSMLSIEPESDLDKEEVARLCRMMLFLWLAGYSTTAVTTSCAIFELGWDPDLWRALADEQDAIMNEADGDRTVTYDQAMSKMPQLDAYVTETLRLRPAAIGVPRVTAFDIELLGYYVPKGRIVFADIASGQRDNDVYPDADNLIFDRFLKKPKPPGINSFGPPGSPHFCIGATLSKVLTKTTIATLLREYRLTLDPAQSRDYNKFAGNVPESKIVVQNFEKRESI